MKKTVLVTGCNGYIGNALVQRLLALGYKVIGVDNNIKLKWTQELKSQSFIKIETGDKRIAELKKLGDFEFINFDVTKFANLPDVLGECGIVVHLAHQPSAAYSHRNVVTATETYLNNVLGTLQIIWRLKDLNPNIHFIEIESMGIYQPDIGVDIPEDLFTFEYKGKLSVPSGFPKRPGSIYHATKCNNFYLHDCANRWWGTTSTLINQGVVYGNWTPEIESSGINSPLWADECFGTVVNRFIVQAAGAGVLTVFGEGKHKRGFLSLSDSIKCLELLIENPPESGEMRNVNQLQEVLTIYEVAERVKRVFEETIPNEKVDIVNQASPRVENTMGFYYSPETEILKKLNFTPTSTFDKQIKYAFEKLDLKVLQSIAKHMVPKIRW